MATVGSGAYTYEPVENWAKLPPGWSFKEIGGVGVDRHDNVFVFNRGEHPTGGSASALSLSRPAQASLTLRPAGSLSRPKVTFVTRLQPFRLPG